MTTQNSIASQIDAIKALLDTFGDVEPVFVSEYEVERCYGGPEEGGWWYDWLTHKRIIGVFREEGDAVSFCRTLNAEAKQEARDQRRHDRFSVLGGADLEFYFERNPGEFQSTERPHYE